MKVYLGYWPWRVKRWIRGCRLFFSNDSKAWAYNLINRLIFAIIVSRGYFFQFLTLYYIIQSQLSPFSPKYTKALVLCGLSIGLILSVTMLVSAVGVRGRSLIWSLNWYEYNTNRKILRPLINYFIWILILKKQLWLIY